MNSVLATSSLFSRSRLRVACFLPWYLGVKTLALVRQQSPLEVSEKIKVPRSTVRNALLLAPEGRRDWPLRFYSPELLFSPAARLGWVEPDLV